MCGIVGIFNPKFGVDPALLNSMLDLQIHRGPDNTGTFFLDNVGIGLGHNRLSLVDMTEKSNQPFFSSNGEWVIVFNGEIYNYLELKDYLFECFGFCCRTKSDTEVLIELISRMGTNCLNLFDGMFAFCALNVKTSEFFIARDVFGEKPIYYTFEENVFCFASETRSLLKGRSSKPEISISSATELLQYGYIRTNSIYEGVIKLPPGCFVTAKIVGGQLSVSRAVNYSTNSDNSTFVGSYDDALEDLDYLLRQSVSRRLRCDANFGVFLSGGIDSSLVSSYVSEQLHGNFETYTLGFENANLDESVFAESVANKLGSRHFVRTISEADVFDCFSGMVNKMSEPIADPSWIPSALISEFASKRVKACLSGDGADELFLGYSRYQQLEMNWRRLSMVPTAVQVLARKSLDSLPPSMLYTQRFKYSGLLGHENFLKFYNKSQDHWRSRGVVCGSNNRFGDWFDLGGGENRDNYSDLMRDFDLAQYLPNNILYKVDSASMASSLEVRSPFLNVEIAKFAKSLPKDFLVNKVRGKRILYDLLCRKVPSQLVDRPKKGFGVPINEWLSNQLLERASYLFNDVLPDVAPFVNQRVVLDLFRRHIENPVFGRPLYSVYILLDWLESQR